MFLQQLDGLMMLALVIGGSVACIGLLWQVRGEDYHGMKLVMAGLAIIIVSLTLWVGFLGVGMATGALVERQCPPELGSPTRTCIVPRDYPLAHWPDTIKP